MKLRNKKTGEIVDFKIIADYDDITSGWRLETPDGKVLFYDHMDEIHEEWEGYKPKEPLIKDEKIRKAVRVWAEANGFSVFKVYNQHFNTCKVHGAKDRYNPNGSSIEFLGTIAGAEKITYAIEDLCGEGE